MKTCKVENCNRVAGSLGYCSKHYYRFTHGIPLDTLHPRGGKRSPNYKNGSFQYINYHILKKNRQIKFEQQKGKCEICGHAAKEVHHINKDKTNHSLDNLLLLCCKCHGRVHRGKKHKTSVWIRRYGMTCTDLCKKLRCSYPTLKKWHDKDFINFFLGNQKCG